MVLPATLGTRLLTSLRPIKPCLRRGLAARVASVPSAFPKSFAVPSDREIEEAVELLEPDAPQWRLPHNVWQSGSVSVASTRPGTAIESLGYVATLLIRGSLDLASGYTWARFITGRLGQRHWLKRVALLEACSSAPGIFGMMAHARLGVFSPSQLHLDRGWIRLLRDDAPKVRMHLAIAMQLSSPGPLFKALVPLMTSFSSWTFTGVYLLCPQMSRYCVDLLQNEMVQVYSQLLDEIEAGSFPELRENSTAPAFAVQHYGLPATATKQDVLRCILEDELLAR